MNIRVGIDQLVLEGMSLSLAQRRQLQAAVEAELGRLLAEGGVATRFQTSIAVPEVAATAIQYDAKSSPTQLGHQIAHSVYGGLRS